jgi:hypothetical protein
VGTTTYPQESVDGNLEVRKESLNGALGHTVDHSCELRAARPRRFMSCALQSCVVFPDCPIKTNIADSLARGGDAEIVAQHINDYGVGDNSNPKYPARHTMMKAHAQPEQERGNHSTSEIPDSRLVSER